MAFDASVVKCFVKEAKEILINAKIDKVHQPQKEEILLSIRTLNGNKKLCISADPSCPRIYLTEEKFKNPETAPMFCMLLRKHLVSARIVDIAQYDFERIIVITLKGYDELSDLTTKKLIIELMGKYSNIILTDAEDKIIDSIKRIDISSSLQRQILPSLTYRYPEKQNKLNPLECSFENINLDCDEPEKTIMLTFYGISKLTAREIVYLAECTDTLPALNTIFDKIKTDSFMPCIIYNEDGSPLDFSAIDILQYESVLTKKTFATISQTIEEFYYEKALKLRLGNRSAQLQKILTNNIERCRKKLAIFNKQLLDCADREKYKQFGELITANLYQIKDGDSSVTLLNYFDESYPEITIVLDKDISPSKNAQKYFAKYTKAKMTEEQSIIQKDKTEKELEYLESSLDCLLRATTLDEIEEIKEELISEGYVSDSNSKKKKTKNASVSMPKEVLFDGYTIYVGRNNRQNDYLTLKLARSNDMWLHTKNIPGSHVIIVKKQEEEIPDNVIVEAAKLAAINSKAKGMAKTPVDFTTVKNVKKPSGAKPGMVIYDNYNTTYVTP